MEDENELIAKVLADEFAKHDEKDEFLDDNNDDDDIGLVERLRKSNPYRDLEILSPEDLIWADTCLVADPEMPAEIWTSLKENLLDSITAFASSYEPMQEDNEGVEEESKVVEEDDRVKYGGQERVESQEDFESPENVFREWDLQVSEEQEEDEISSELNKKLAEIESFENVFKLWDLRVLEEEEDDEISSELNKKVAVIESSENVFKVGDSCVAEEEEDDELWTILNKAVAVFNLRDEQKLSTDGGIPSADEELEELIANVGDLSLKPNFKNIGEKSS